MLQAVRGDRVTARMADGEEITVTVTDTPTDRVTSYAIWYHDDEYHGVKNLGDRSGWYFREILSIQRVFHSGDNTVTVTLTPDTTFIEYKHAHCCGGFSTTTMEIPREVLI